MGPDENAVKIASGNRLAILAERVPELFSCRINAVFLEELFVRRNHKFRVIRPFPGPLFGGAFQYLDEIILKKGNVFSKESLFYFRN
jgi:hypothetical protein